MVSASSATWLEYRGRTLGKTRSASSRRGPCIVAREQVDPGRWLPIWSATTSPLSQRRFRPRRRLRCRRKQGPIQFLENNPIQSSLWVRFMCPKTRRNWLRLPIVRFHPGSSCPQQPPRGEATPAPKATAISALKPPPLGSSLLPTFRPNALIVTAGNFNIMLADSHAASRLSGRRESSSRTAASAFQHKVSRSPIL